MGSSRADRFGVDGSPVAVRALDSAADEAARRGAALHLVYAVPDRDEAGTVLASAASRVRKRHPGLPVVASAAAGGAVRAPARESGGAALTVVGTRGPGGLTGLLLGSVSRRLAAHVHGPLPVVRGDHPCGDNGEVLLGPADDTDADVAAHAFQEAERRGARLRVPHSWTHRHITPELPSLVPATSPGQQQLAQQDRGEEAVPRFAMARLREQHPEAGIETARSAPTRRRQCWRPPARPASSSSAPTAAPVGSARSWGRSRTCWCTTPTAR